MPILEPWSTDPEFVALLRLIRGRTVVDAVRCYMLYQYAKAAAPRAHLAEVGVYKGGTARMISEAMPRGCDLHLFDTFSGMPPCDPKRDMHHEGDFKDTSLEAVQGFMVDCQHTVFHPGVFPATVKNWRAEQMFSLVHVDADIYRSVLDCCTFFFPRLLSGGVMIFDDYGAISCPGAKAAVDEYFCGLRRRPIYLPTGQAVVTKLE